MYKHIPHNQQKKNKGNKERKKNLTECSHFHTHRQTWGVQSVPCQYFQFLSLDIYTHIHTQTLTFTNVYTHTPWTTKALSQYSKTTKNDNMAWKGPLYATTAHSIERPH